MGKLIQISHTTNRDESLNTSHNTSSKRRKRTHITLENVIRLETDGPQPIKYWSLEVLSLLCVLVF